METKSDGAPRMTGAVLNAEGGPWGGGSNNGGNGGGGDDDGGLGPRNPWTQPPKKKGPRKGPNPAAIEELLRRGRSSFGGRMPGDFDGRKTFGWALLAIVAIWIAFTSIWGVDPQERGVVTQLGRFSRILTPGLRLTLPAPFETVTKVVVEQTNTIDVGSTAEDSQNLMLTGDQNIVDLAYSVRWKIRDPELYIFELQDPEETIKEVAESAMREEIGRVTLNDAIGSQRGEIADRVQARMQMVLNSYRAGVQVLGIAIKQADPPSAVNDAFKEVSAAQQTAETYVNQARAYSQQLGAKASGEAQAFDKVYEQYRLAPEVTRRRMYYETMEKVLSKVDKTIVEAPGVTPYLALPEVKRRAAQGGEAQQ
ncbi:FtsH protease activity modulator HflK [Sphingomonas sp. ID0503]|uniref:FtsH protease activity modulator HflK n=1 Tax=Sphingomonas sp. ID0503 TaxID=3399691 RepID=UPI003AFB61E8